MKIVRKSEILKFDHGQACTAFEYPINDEDINVAVIELNGRYPAQGFAMNETSKELAYVIEGSGMVVVESKETNVGEGDLVFVNPGEKFFWEGKMKLLMPCTPAWTPDQYKLIE